MRSLNFSLNQRSQTYLTTLCQCWRLLRKDGLILGFTDHDEDIYFGNTTFSARTGFLGSEVETKLGLAISGMEVSGALTSENLKEEDICAGLYDGATIEIWNVNWENVEERVLMDIGMVGNIDQIDYAFTCEIRSLSSYFDQERGRCYQSTCCAELGDLKCKKNIKTYPFQTEGFITNSEQNLLLSTTLENFEEGWFTGGLLTFTNTEPTGLSYLIKQDQIQNKRHIFSLWEPLSYSIPNNQSFIATCGCDKTLKTCATKFSNQINFRGMPLMPGEQILLFQGDLSHQIMDGRSLWK